MKKEGRLSFPFKKHRTSLVASSLLFSVFRQPSPDRVQRAVLGADRRPLEPPHRSGRAALPRGRRGGALQRAEAARPGKGRRTGGGRGGNRQVHVILFLEANFVGNTCVKSLCKTGCFPTASRSTGATATLTSSPATPSRRSWRARPAQRWTRTGRSSRTQVRR